MRKTALFAVPALFLLTFLAWRTVASACGISTHEEVTQRAVRTFASEAYPEYERFVRDHQDAIQPGAVFPDFGYAFGLPDESEAAHWPPFLMAFAAHIHDHYPKPWDEETEKLAAFLLGQSSHSRADVDWHSLGVAEGFIEAMSQQDFQGNYGDAHSHADIADDVLVTYQLNLSWLSNRWYIPADDLAEIFHSQGFPDITPDDIRGRMAIMFLGAQAERLGLGLLHDYFAKPSPFMWEQFKDYFVGGLDSMAARVSWHWADVIDWIENGPPPDDGGKRPETALHEDLDGWLFSNLELLDALRYTFTERRTARGVIFEIRFDETAAGGEKSAPVIPPDADRSIDFRGETSHAYLGSSLAAGDFNQDGIDDLAIGAPGYWEKGAAQLGVVYVSYGRTQIGGRVVSDVDAGGASQAFKGSDVFGRFGWALAAVDLNADGADDLAASAPTAGAHDMRFRGKVFVFFGDPATKSLSETPDIVIETDADYTNLGFSLAGGDVDGDGHKDLLIGAPFAREGGTQKGLAALFLSTRAPSSGTVWTLADADWTASGENDYDWFGYDVGIAAAPGAGSVILIGAPAVNIETGVDGEAIQSVGRLYGFAPDGARLFSITGAAEFDKMGQSFAAGSPYGDGETWLALGSPTKTEGGKTYAGEIILLDLAGLDGDLNARELRPATILRGTTGIARFGWRIGFADFNGDGVSDLIATRPWMHAEKGAAYLWLGGSLPKGTVDDPPASTFWTLDGGYDHSFFGSAIAFPDFDGDGSADLAFAAPSSSEGAYLGGEVSLVLAPAPRATSVSPGVAMRGTQSQMTLTGLRLLNQHLQVAIASGDSALLVSSVKVLIPETVSFVLDVPGDAPTGAYALTMRTIYGSSVLENAVTVTEPEGDDDSESERACGC